MIETSVENEVDRQITLSHLLTGAVSCRVIDKLFSTFRSKADTNTQATLDKLKHVWLQKLQEKFPESLPLPKEYIPKVRPSIPPRFRANIPFSTDRFPGFTMAPAYMERPIRPNNRSSSEPSKAHDPVSSIELVDIDAPSSSSGLRYSEKLIVKKVRATVYFL